MVAQSLFRYIEPYFVSLGNGRLKCESAPMRATMLLKKGTEKMVKQTILDVIVFKNGDLLNGRVLTPVFHIKTAYGKIQVKKGEIANIHMRGNQFKADQIVTLELNRFKGTFEQKVVEVKLQNGQNMKIPKNKIHTIMMLTNY